MATKSLSTSPDGRKFIPFIIFDIAASRAAVKAASDALASTGDAMQEELKPDRRKRFPITNPPGTSPHVTMIALEAAAVYHDTVASGNGRAQHRQDDKILIDGRIFNGYSR